MVITSQGAFQLLTIMYKEISN